MKEQQDTAQWQQRLQNACQRTRSFSKTKKEISMARSVASHISFLMMVMTSRCLNTARQKMGGNKYLSFHDT